MKDSVYKFTKEGLRNFENETEAINYYEHLLNENPESASYPKLLRELHKGIIMGLKASLELKRFKK